MSFSSKQWINRLSALLGQLLNNTPVEIEDAEKTHDSQKSYAVQFNQAATVLVNQCLEMVAVRLRFSLQDYSLMVFNDSSRTLLAFREAGVKFTAIVHGLWLQFPQEPRLLPMVRGGLLVVPLMELDEKLMSGELAPSTARALLRTYRDISKKLGWNENGELDLLFSTPERRLAYAEEAHKRSQALAYLDEIHGFINSAQDLVTMTRKIAGGHKLHPKQQAKLDALRKWIGLNRQDITSKIQALDTEYGEPLLAQSNGLLLELLKPIEQIALEVRASIERPPQPARKKHRRKRADKVAALTAMSATETVIEPEQIAA